MAPGSSVPRTATGAPGACGASSSPSMPSPTSPPRRATPTATPGSRAFGWATSQGGPRRWEQSDRPRSTPPSSTSRRRGRRGRCPTRGRWPPRLGSSRRALLGVDRAPSAHFRPRPPRRPRIGRWRLRAELARASRRRCATAPDGRWRQPTARSTGRRSPLLVLWQAATILREHRGDGHVAALVVAGLDGCEAHVSFVATGAVIERGSPAQPGVDRRGVGRGRASVWSSGAGSMKAARSPKSDGKPGRDIERVHRSTGGRARGGGWARPAPTSWPRLLEPLATAVTSSGTIPFDQSHRRAPRE